MMNKPLGLYVHIPFCLRKCAYCDFYSVGGADETLISSYVDALSAELSAAAEIGRGRELTSLFFGGGTPSVLPTAELERLMSRITSDFSISSDCEISLEANPGTVDRQKLSDIRCMGFNRLSVGVQSFSDRELSILGRIHSSAEATEAVTWASEVGFDNLSLDLMYAIPHQTLESFMRNIDTALSLGVSHISAYSLIIEPGTPFYEKRESMASALPDEDTEYQMYLDCVERLTSAGFSHYEISNYAHKGRECRHNMLYWSGDEYIGVGPAASSYFGGRRYKSTEDLAGYIRAASEHKHPVSCCEDRTVDISRAEEEYIMLSLRTAVGIREDVFRERFGRSFAESYRHRLSLLSKVGSGLFRLDSDGMRLTHKGMYLSNTIINMLI